MQKTEPLVDGFSGTQIVATETGKLERICVDVLAREEEEGWGGDEM